MLSICLHGCCGHMGRVVTETVRRTEDLQIVCGVDPAGAAADPGFPVFTRIEDAAVDYDVVIDFSTAAAVDVLLDHCAANGKPLVLCTTGLSDRQKNKVAETAAKIPVFFSANMSLGVNLLTALSEKAAAILAPAGFDIEIEERHHRRKLDAPSGTALMIGEAIAASLNDGHYLDTGRMDRREARDPLAIGLSALRGGTIVGEHSVVFAGHDEILELHHSALSRDIFAGGAVSAARFLSKQPAGLYDMRQLLENA